MKHEICVVNDFLTAAHREKVCAAAERHGYTVRFFETPEAAEGQLGQCEILYSHYPDLLRQAPELKWYCCSFAGVEPYMQPGIFPNEECLLTNSSGAYGVTIAEHMVMVTLMLMRRIMEYQASMARREWIQELPIRSILGSRITVLGTGDIGSNYARRAKAMGAAKVVGVNRSGGSGEPAYDAVYPSARLEEVLPQTEVLAMAMPSTAQTAGILSRERIALLPQNALVLNVGRGSAIDQEALIEALNAGRIAGAALDVMTPEPLPADHPLWSARNVLLTPHISGDMTLGWTCDKNVDLFCEDIENYCTGRPLIHAVDRTLGY